MIFGKYINRYYLRYLPVLLLGILTLIVVDVAQLEIPKLYRTVVNGLVDGVITEGGVSVPFDLPFVLREVCLPMATVILLIVLGRFLWRVCFRGSAFRMETHLRGKMFDHAVTLSQQYYQEHKVGSLMTLFTNDLETVQDCFGWGVLMLCDALFLGALSLLEMYRMDPALTLLSLIPMAFLLLIGALLDHRLEARWDKRQAAFSSLSDMAQESFSGIAVIKAFVKETVERITFRRRNKENEDTNVAHAKLSTLLTVLVTLFVESVICVILGYGGYLVHLGRFNAGQLVEFIGYFTSIIWPIMAVSQLIEMRSRGKASLKRISALLDTEPTVRDAEGVRDIEGVRGEITLSGLTFRYPGASYDALREVSFTVAAGEHVGIIGKTGAGKTTLVDLLLRTYDVPTGTLFLDGADVRTLSISSVRAAMAYVPQDNFLFSESIGANIGFAVDAPTEDGIRRAATLADVHDNIMGFADGYGTVLGERGVTVSGGQKQRISIARALEKDAAVLILDDAVSAVDVHTEKIILENLRRERAGKTTLLIAHRISTVEGMDKIVFLDDGAVVAVGTHEELLSTCPAYARTVELQRLDDERAALEAADRKEVMARA